VQPGIPQTLIWDETKDDERFAQLMRLSELALTNKTDLLIWPEAAVPKLVRYDKNTFEAVTGMAAKHKTWMIIGADDAERSPDNPDKVLYYNSSFLINPEGKLIDRYRKRALVIFGEYIPLVRWLPVFKWFTPIQGGFTAGDKPLPFHLPTLRATTSVLICFEDVFPHVARLGIASSDFLVNLTNDGWFGEGAAQWQQAVAGLFRAVENGVPLIRCTNNGLTCWIDSCGRLRLILRGGDSSVYAPGVLAFELPLPESRPPPTFYTLHGDVFGWSCVVIAIILLLWAISTRVRARKLEQYKPSDLNT
jgi:apolipoprotein N-acyltransferase